MDEGGGVGGGGYGRNKRRSSNFQNFLISEGEGFGIFVTFLINARGIAITKQGVGQSFDNFE